VKATAEVLDDYGDRAAVCTLEFKSFGRAAFSGRIATVRCFEDNVLLRKCLEQPGDHRVLVVDGGGSRRCALLGDEVANRALENSWTGIIINGCVRDALALNALPFGVKAIGTNPRPSRKDGAGAIDVALEFGGVTFNPGALLYADDDGVVVVE